MNVKSTEIPGVLVIEPKVFPHSRGGFLETWQAERYAAIGVPSDFVQDNLSSSNAGVLRGLHLQHPHDQAKLVQTLVGTVFDVAVDVRVGSPTFGTWVGAELSDETFRQLYIPAGFAHGFCVVSDFALFSYKCSDFYAPDCEIAIRWDDPDIGIDWPLSEPVVSGKDAQGLLLKDIDPDRLPCFVDRP